MPVTDHQEEFKQIFFTECAELLTDMEERLLKLESGVHDAEQLNYVLAPGQRVLLSTPHQAAALEISRNGNDVTVRKASALSN